MEALGVSEDSGELAADADRPAALGASERGDDDVCGARHAFPLGAAVDLIHLAEAERLPANLEAHRATPFKRTLEAAADGCPVSSFDAHEIGQSDPHAGANLLTPFGMHSSGPIWTETMAKQTARWGRC